METELLDFFGNMLQPYDNGNGVIIDHDAHHDDYFMNCRVDGLTYPERSLYLSCENLTMALFIKKFDLISIGDLWRIGREKLLRLYETGDACYWCMFGGGTKSLEFTKYKDKMYVKDFDSGETDFPSTLLLTPDDFLDCTEYYFKGRKDKLPSL